MDTKFLNFKKSKTFDPHRLLIYLVDTINLKRSDKYFVLSNLNILSRTFNARNNEITWKQ